MARSGQESIAQGAAENRLRTFLGDRVRISSPFRAKRSYRLTQGKPWAKLSCPFGAGPSGLMTGAKHILAGPQHVASSLCLPCGHCAKVFLPS